MVESVHARPSAAHMASRAQGDEGSQRQPTIGSQTRRPGSHMYPGSHSPSGQVASIIGPFRQTRPSEQVVGVHATEARQVPVTASQTAPVHAPTSQGQPSNPGSQVTQVPEEQTNPPSQSGSVP